MPIPLTAQAPIYPSLQELGDTHSASQELPGRWVLIWQSNGPLETAVLVKQGGNVPEAYCIRTSTNTHQLAHNHYLQSYRAQNLFDQGPSVRT